MALFPEARCAIALGWSLGSAGAPGDVAVEYAHSVAAAAEAAGFRLQFFLSSAALEPTCDWLRRLVSAGHVADVLGSEQLASADGDAEAAGAQLAQAAGAVAACAGQAPHGVRVPGAAATGLHDLPGRQQVVLRQGMTYVSSLYATKSPTSKYDIFADKNAYMIMKHHQPRRYESGLLEIPMSGYADDHFFDELQRPLDQWIQHLRNCLDFAYDMGGLLHAPALHLEVHARHDPQCEAMAALVDHAHRKHDPVRFCTYREVAAEFARGEVAGEP